MRLFRSTRRPPRMFRESPIIVMIGMFVLIGLGNSPLRAQTFLERLERRINEALPLNPPAGGVPRAAQGRGYLGLSAEDVEGGGVRVLTVRAGSPALAAGIRPGDEIRSLDGVAVRDVDQMGAVLDQLPPGARVDFGIRRQGKTFEARVTLGRTDGPAGGPADVGEEIPVPPPEVLPGESPTPAATPTPAVTGRPTLGVVLAPLTDALRQKFGVTARNGALVTEVRPGGTAEAAGIGAGSVIVGFDDLRIEEPEPLLAAVRERRIGDTVALSWYDGNELRRKSIALRSPAPSASSNSSSGAAGSKKPVPLVPGTISPDARPSPAGKSPPRASDGLFPDSPENTEKPSNPESLEEQVLRLTRTVEMLQRRIEELEKRFELPP